MEQPPSYDEIEYYPTLPNRSSGNDMSQLYMQQHQYYRQPQQFQNRNQQSQQHWNPQPPQSQPQMSKRQKMNAIPFFDDNTERRRLTELSDMFAIIKATEYLESAFSRDVVKSEAYTESCDRLLTHFKSTESALVTSGIIKSAEEFYRDYNMDCPRAFDRLMKSGVSAVKLLGGGIGSSSQEPDSVVVAETVQAFITAIDALALENFAIDTIQPLLTDLISSLTRVSSLPPDFEALVKVRLWLQKLNEMRAYEELKEEEARQLKFDLESTYQAFMKHLSSSRAPP